MGSQVDEAWAKCLRFLSMIDAVKASVLTSKSLHKIVNCDSFHWGDISFPVSYRWNGSTNTRELYGPATIITDAMLSSLLTRVNSKEQTVTISLRGCINITGAGLKPLRGSTKLQVLDLKSELGPKRKARGPITTLSFNAIQPLVSSMLSGNKDEVPSLEVVNLR